MQEIRLPSLTLIPSCIVILTVRDEAVLDAVRRHIDAADMEHIGRMEGDRSTYNRFEPTSEFAQPLMAQWQEVGSGADVAGADARSVPGVPEK